MTRHRLLIAARPYDLSDAPFDAFVDRHLRLTHAAMANHDVTILGLRTEHDAASISQSLAGVAYEEVELTKAHLTRAQRVRALVDPALVTRQALRDTEIGRVVAHVSPDQSLTIGPWLNNEYQPIFSAVPTIHLFEEDLRRMPELAPQSRQARSLRWVETKAWSLNRFQPNYTLVISDAETASARAWFPKSTVDVLPYTLDPVHWPLAESVSPGDGVLVVGQMAQGRNAEGLADVLDELARQESAIRVSVVSGAGLHPSLNVHADSGRLVPQNSPDNIYDAYRSAAVVLVPSTRSTGMKTTILQAWCAGCPVVCFDSSARTLGRAGEFIGGAHDAVSVSNRLEELLASPSARRAHFERARQLMQSTFDDARALRRFAELIAGLAT